MFTHLSVILFCWLVGGGGGAAAALVVVTVVCRYTKDYKVVQNKISRATRLRITYQQRSLINMINLQ